MLIIDDKLSKDVLRLELALRNEVVSYDLRHRNACLRSDIKRVPAK